MPRLCSRLLLSLLIASSGSAITMAWTPIGNPGNAADPGADRCGPNGDQLCGDVPYAYNIGTYEVTNAQYTAFLNAVATTDTNGLYDVSMSNPGTFSYGGITRSGSSGSYAYSAIAGRGNMPVNFIGFYDALRFTNWMNNGQPTGTQNASTTEDGTYTITAQGVTENSIVRNSGATIVLPSASEWYKAAYYDPSSSIYYDYPTGSNAPTTCATPSAAANQANCNSAVGDLTNIGSYTGSASPYGTFDQGGNVSEWNETVFPPPTQRELRGGSYGFSNGYLRGDTVDFRRANQTQAYPYVGFRLAMIPEPGTDLLVIAGLLGLAGWRRMRD